MCVFVVRAWYPYWFCEWFFPSVSIMRVLSSSLGDLSVIERVVCPACFQFLCRAVDARIGWGLLCCKTLEDTQLESLVPAKRMCVPENAAQGALVCCLAECPSLAIYMQYGRCDVFTHAMQWATPAHHGMPIITLLCPHQPDEF